MIKKNTFHGRSATGPNSQKGAAILVTVILMFTLVSSITIYTTKVVSSNNRIALNGQNKQLATVAAESGAMYAYALLAKTPNWDGSVLTETLPDGSTFSVSGVRQNVRRASSTVRVIDITSIGVSPDGLGNETIREQAFQYSVVANPPDVPLIVAGGINVSGNFEVAANPNGGGTGVPLSIWTDSTVDMNNGSGTTCGQYEFQSGQCSSRPYSEKGFKNTDILDNDPSFPADMMEYLFNTPSDDWATVRADANVITNSCASLGAASTGLIWVEGSCNLNAGTVVGSISNPVVLVVADSDINLNGGAEINGMVFSFRKPGTLSDFEIDMNGGALVNGIVASNHPVGHANGSFNSVFNADVVNNLQVNDAFQRIARIPGSWRDF
ncbi:pilus assembly PilX N-terminal domain-containing protein [Glaciecola sp. MH2013]|uniref:pilus assembly PilX N-terminal domain-containing protein n=1 Tax=Glaciecola sp. MH2013 TaxID=2785524 RepID=UPI00189DF780|nr:pilus assembly PilX N-terminal domain-containing protein [Glaciecola sp. MH2013]MBF7073792.1 pilus assembly PilX N-terminal domain-containing protein [Glaciecola sp. MH2013]